MEKEFLMNINNFDTARYPLIIQVIDHLLVIYSPDFDYRVAEPYRPSDIGQTEMMILKVRREIASKIAKKDLKTPAPSKTKDLIPNSPDSLLTVLDVARLLRISESSVRRMTDRGELTSVTTPGGHRRYSRALVEKLKSATFRSLNQPQSTVSYTSTDQSPSPSHLSTFEPEQNKAVSPTPSAAKSKDDDTYMSLDRPSFGV